MSPVASGLGLRRGLRVAFCAVLLLSGTCWPASTPETKHLTAILITAQDDLADSDFAGSIVLVMNNLGTAPVGVIINRPTQVPVSRLFPDLKRLAPLSDKVYFGGPVEFETVWFLFRSATPPKDAIQVLDGVYISAKRELLHELLGRDKPMDGLRIFIGHAGWAPGQLEGELAHGFWFTTPQDAKLVFDDDRDAVWDHAMKRRTQDL